MASHEKGFLVPEWYVPDDPNPLAMNIASIFWGFSLACAVFTAAKAARQTHRSWRRRKRITPYIFMIWGEWLANVIMGVISWTFQRGYFAPSFWFYWGVAFVWVFQMHFLLQIIINRIALLMVVRGQATRLKIIVFCIVLFINISVFIIWIPARLQISETWIRVNFIWDKIEKILFCIVDAFLNIYFVVLVRTQLLENGLTKYIPLYKINLLNVGISLFLDIALIGLMFSNYSLMYLQFHPVVYLSKLQIEMDMADLIVKVVRASKPDEYQYDSTSKGDKSGGTAANKTASGAAKSRRFRTIGGGYGNGTTTAAGAFARSLGGQAGAHHTVTITGNEEQHELDDNKAGAYTTSSTSNHGGENGNGGNGGGGGGGGSSGIQRTVETSVVVEDDSNSTSSSTRELARHYGVEPPGGVQPHSRLEKS